MFCGNCGEKLDDGVKFCGKCGTKFPENTSSTPVAVGTEQGVSQIIPTMQPPDQETITTLISRGNAYHEESQYDLAIKEFTEAIRLDPNNVYAFIRRGVAYEANNQDDLAITDFNAAIQLNSNNGDAFSKRGNFYYNKDQYDLAIADFTEAIRINPNENKPWVFFKRGHSYALLEQYDLAISDCSKAIQLYPEYSMAFKTRAESYFSLGQYDLAIADYTEVIRIYQSGDFMSDLFPGLVPSAYNFRGLAYGYNGQYDLAIADHSAAIQLDPNFSHCFNNRANAYYGKDQYDLAIADVTEAIRLDPNNSGFRKNLEVFKQAKGNCFITTAVCGSFSKPDDCYELTQFRNFRDNWLLAQPDGKQIVDRYYQIAPGIVAAIGKTSESKAVYTDIWNDYLAECLCLIEAGKLEDCKTKYTDMVETLEQRYLV